MHVLIVMGSKSDMPVAEKAIKMLNKLGISHEVTVASAHRTPKRTEDLSKREDVDVFIAIAGLAAALPGVVAAHTTKPVIGVPVSGKVPLDSLLSIVQMPPGIPVAAVGVDRGDNAALLAASILSVANPEIARKLAEYRNEMAQKVLADAKSLEG